MSKYECIFLLLSHPVDFDYLRRSTFRKRSEIKIEGNYEDKNQIFQRSRIDHTEKTFMSEILKVPQLNEQRAIWFLVFVYNLVTCEFHNPLFSRSLSSNMFKKGLKAHKIHVPHFSCRTENFGLNCPFRIALAKEKEKKDLQRSTKASQLAVHDDKF